MPETPHFKWPYPLGSDDVDVPEDLDAAIQAIEDTLIGFDIHELGTAGAEDKAKLLVVDEAGLAQWKAMSGDATIDQAGAVTIGNLKVTTAKIAEKAVTSAKLAALSVLEEHLGAGSVAPDKIKAFAVEEGKIKDKAVTLRKLAEEVIRFLVPTGAILASGLTAAPSGWLLCQGAAVSRTEYKTLFEAIGTAYGAGDGSTTFNVPNLQGRVPVGSGGLAASPSALGNVGGEEYHQLTINELPAHTHTEVAWGGFTYWINRGLAYADNAALDGPGFPQASGSVGANWGHNTMQPYQIVNYIIKA